MSNYQNLDSSYQTQDLYLEGHYIHHFNGAVINFVPLVKKLGIHTVVGTSALLIPQYKYQYVEIFGGVERTFKVARTRFRLGVYFVEAASNFNSIDPRIKFGINFYSFQNDDWGY